MDAELYFESNKSFLQNTCCHSNIMNKIQAFKIPIGYRIYCQSCCAVADGSTMDIAMENFRLSNFKYDPQ